RRALAEPPEHDDRRPVLVDLGVAEARANEPAAAIEHLRAATAVTADGGDLGAVAGLLARLRIFTDPPDDAVAGSPEARPPVSPTAPGRDALDTGLAAVELYAVHFGAADGDAATRVADVAAPPASAGVGARMLAATAAWDRALSGGPADECRELAEAAL